MPQTFNVGARSVFVSAVAWIFMALALGITVWALLRHAELGSVLLSLSPQTGLGVVVSEYFPWVLGFGLSLSGATLAAAVGLLMRLDWARRTFIALLVLAIMFNLGGLWVQHEIVQSVVDSAFSRATLPAPVMDVVGGFVTASRVMGVAVTLTTCALLAWIVRRLMSAAVRQEFA